MRQRQYSTTDVDIKVLREFLDRIVKDIEERWPEGKCGRFVWYEDGFEFRFISQHIPLRSPFPPVRLVGDEYSSGGSGGRTHKA